MDMVLALLIGSGLIWYIVDRFKSLVWEDFKGQKYLTMAAAAVLSAVLTFSMNMDLLVALELSADVSIVGQVFTVLTLMTGSSAVSEVMARIREY